MTDMQGLRFLITGGTGFLGKHLIAALEKAVGPGAVIDCISRTNAKHLKGDLTHPDAQMDLEALKDRYDVLVHLAGLYDLRANPSEAHKQNVIATHNALVIAQRACIPHFFHASTVAVTVGEAPPERETITPDALDTARTFPDHYARTKAQAEKLVREWPMGTLRSKLNLRLGILVGDTHSGTISRIDGPYHAARFLDRQRGLIDKYLKTLPLPGNPKRALPLVPVDVAAAAITKLIRISRSEGWKGYKSLHLFPSRGMGPKEFYESAMRNLGYKKTVFKLIKGVPKSILKRLIEWVSRIPKEELEYLFSFPRLDVSETERILGADWCPDFRSYETAFWKGYRAYASKYSHSVSPLTVFTIEGKCDEL